MSSFYLKYRCTGTRKNIKLKSLEQFEDKNIMIEFVSQTDKFGNRLTVKLHAKVPVIIEECRFHFELNYVCENVMTNGYQSNSESIDGKADRITKSLNPVAKIFSLQHMGHYKNGGTSFQTKEFFRILIFISVKKMMMKFGFMVP